MRLNAVFTRIKADCMKGGDVEGCRIYRNFVTKSIANGAVGIMDWWLVCEGHDMRVFGGREGVQR
jgi:hypothetical protein